MDYFFYNTDAGALRDQPRPRFRVLIDQGFAAVGGDRQKYGEQFDQLAAPCFRFRDSPLHQLLADAAAAAVGSNADVFEQTARAALRADAR